MSSTRPKPRGSAPVPSPASDTHPDGAGTALPADEALAEVALWYHTLELPGGVVTPGWFDLRPIADEVPWPDLEGARCLDLATYDGFWAFEMEARGAAEVVATDIRSHEDWDWLPRDRVTGPAQAVEMAGTKGRGFEVARDLRGSKVERRWRSVYDLDPAVDGRFDVVVLGALLLHLRDPFRALEAIHGVCDGVFLSIEQADPVSSLLHRKRPVLYLEGRVQRWTVPNLAGHRRMLEIAGFDVQDQRRFSEPFGEGHHLRAGGGRVRRRGHGHLVQRLLFGGSGIPTSAIVATPAEVAPRPGTRQDAPAVPDGAT